MGRILGAMSEHRERVLVTLAGAIDEEAARVRLGRLVGGDEGARLVAEGESRIRGEGVACPDRFVAMLAPGFAGS